MCIYVKTVCLHTFCYLYMKNLLHKPVYMQRTHKPDTACILLLKKRLIQDFIGNFLIISNYKQHFIEI